MLTSFCVSEMVWPRLTARICITFVKVAVGKQSRRNYRTNWAHAVDIMCTVLANSAAGMITLGVRSYIACYLAHYIPIQHVISHTLCYLTHCVPTQHVSWQCSYTSCYLKKQWVPMQHVTWHSVFLHCVTWHTDPMQYVTWHIVFLHNMLFDTVCSYTECYLAHCVSLHSMLPDTMCILTKCVTLHVFLHSMLLVTLFLQSVLFGTVCS